MSFLAKFKSNATPASPTIGNGPGKKDPNALQPSALDKHIAELQGPPRLDGSDKFFGFENYSSTCYCNSVLQCLYYSAPFRDNVLSFPPAPQTNGHADGSPLLALDTGSSANTRRNPLTTKPLPTLPGPLAVNSPARKPIVLPGTPAAVTTKPDEKDGPDWKKKMLMQNVPILDMQLGYAEAYNMQESLFTAMKDIFEAIIAHPGRTGIVSPHKFLEVLRKENEMFRSAMHQDAHEFLNFLLNQVVDNVELYSKLQDGLAKTNGTSTAMTTIPKSAIGWVHDLFEGTLVSETRCLTCENVSQRDEAFMDLSVDLEAHSSVTACLRKFSEEEMLCERNKFHCDNCGGLQEAEKRMKIKRLPRILALHLKRFKYTEDYNRLQKLFHRVEYPFHLRLFNTTDDAENSDRLYELYAVVVHIGGGPYHGHYVSIIKTQDRGWLLFDDELVEPVDKSYVQNFFGGEPKPGVQDAKQLACAYVLFYQETTLEAVQREQETENQPPIVPADSGDGPLKTDIPPGSPNGASAINNFWGNGLRQMQTVVTPTDEKDEQFASLAHAATAPSLSPDPRPGMPTSNSLFAAPTNTSSKSKRDLKKEEKQAEKDRKAAVKEAEKAALAKRRELFDERRARLKQQEEELNAAIEASKLSAAEEAGRAPLVQTTTNTDGAGSGAGAVSAGSTRARFTRHSSMSLRQKPSFWPGGKKAVGVEPVPEVKETGEEEKEREKRNRFSIGRKGKA
ncbi:hypothetical protein MBLNU457_7715t2 [Dothideomycetes sp. NU457]